MWNRDVNGKQIVFVSLSVVFFAISGCATTGNVTETSKLEVNRTPKPATKTANTYVVERSAVLTPGSIRPQVPPQASNNTQRPSKRTTTASRKPQAASPAKPAYPQLTREQYHERYIARQKAAQVAAAERKRAQQLVQQKREQAQKQATRQQYIAKWKQQEAERERYHQQWQQNQSRQQVAKTTAPSPSRQPAKTPAPVQVAAAKSSPAQAQTRSATKQPSANREKYLARWRKLQQEKKLEAKKADQRVERVIHNAKKQLGTKYVWGGASPKTGFDCSGLVQHSMKQGADVTVPRTAAEQYRAAVKVAQKDAERGDLVFFKTRGNSVSHVGIYLGNDSFVHAPRTGRRITTSKLSGYWKKRFVGFGRIPGACKVRV